MSLSQEELWIGAAYLVSINRTDLIKPDQRQALATFEPDAQLFAEVVNDVLPCPLCPRFPDPPLVFQGRWSGKWAMRSGPVGCPHAEMKEFLAFAPTRAEVVERWNAWVKRQTPPEFPRTPKAPDSCDSKGGAGAGETNCPAQSRAGQTEGPIA